MAESKIEVGRQRGLRVGLWIEGRGRQFAFTVKPDDAEGDDDVWLAGFAWAGVDHLEGHGQVVIPREDGVTGRHNLGQAN